VEAQSNITPLVCQQRFVSPYSDSWCHRILYRMKNKGPTGEEPVGPKNTCKKLQPEQSRPEGIQMFSSVRPADRCLPIGSLGGRDKITSEVCLPHTITAAQHARSKKIYRAKKFSPRRSQRGYAATQKKSKDPPLTSPPSRGREERWLRAFRIMKRPSEICAAGENFET
jgi:hypothetical protein